MIRNIAKLCCTGMLIVELVSTTIIVFVIDVIKLMFMLLYIPFILVTIALQFVREWLENNEVDLIKTMQDICKTLEE